MRWNCCTADDVCDECYARAEYARTHKRLRRDASDCTCGRTPVAFRLDSGDWQLECCEVWYTAPTLDRAIAGWNRIIDVAEDQ